jgi:flagellar assembly protein FliH
MNTSSKAGGEDLQVAEFSYRELTGRQAGGPDLGQLAPPQRDALQAAMREGEARARAFFDQQLAQERASVQKAITDFRRERSEYYQRVEVEVVQLALAIAHRILHREAAADPLLLAGIVRVALDKLENKTEVSLRVHPDIAAQWRNFFAANAEPHHSPEVVEDASLESGRCVLQTPLGSTELGLEVQLKEVEQGLMDLQAQRPKVER